MTDDKKMVEDWLCEHFPYHLRVDKDIPKGVFIQWTNSNPFQTIRGDFWMWKDNPPIKSLEDLMCCCPSIEELHSIQGYPYRGPGNYMYASDPYHYPYGAVYPW